MHPATMTAADYLAWEATQTERHEFIDGEVWALAGATDRHVTTALNVAMALKQHLRGTPCRTFMSDMKLHAESANSHFYPDVVVTCSEADWGRPLIKRDTRRADVYRCGADGLWVLHPFDPGQGVAFGSVDLRIEDEALYADLD
jgi:Uma2 family endonuclease